MKKIVIQGIKGCYHHVSLIKYLWENVYEIVECNTFNKLTQIITIGEANLGVMAMENSIFGSILSNYIFLSNSSLKILGSIVLYIEHNLISLSKNKFNEILSHPIALQQCDNFISEFTHLKKIEYSDTALASLNISKNMLKTKASIASLRASKEYGLSIIYKNIQSLSNNFTRFFIIEISQRKIKENWDKSSILFRLNKNCHKKLLNILNIIAYNNIYITNILSFLNKPGEYLFYIDVVIDDYMGYEQMKSNIKNKSHTFSILGEYMDFIIL